MGMQKIRHKKGIPLKKREKKAPIQYLYMVNTTHQCALSITSFMFNVCSAVIHVCESVFCRPHRLVCRVRPQERAALRAAALRGDEDERSHFRLHDVAEQLMAFLMDRR